MKQSFETTGQQHDRSYGHSESRGEERTDFESHNTENYQNMAAIVSKNRQDAI